jgi:hypothetical protein
VSSIDVDDSAFTLGFQFGVKSGLKRFGEEEVGELGYSVGGVRVVLYILQMTELNRQETKVGTRQG